MNDISLSDLAHNFKKNKYLFLTSLLLSFALTVLLGIVIKPKFHAVAVIAQNEIENNNELISFKTGAFGIAALTGEKVGAFEIFLKTLGSADIYEKLAGDKVLIASLLDLSEEEIEKNIVYVSYFNPQRYIRQLYGIPPYEPLNGTTLKRRLGKYLSIKSKNEIYEISFSSRHREHALQTLNDLILFGDKNVKTSYSSSIKGSLDFLGNESSISNYPKTVANAFSKRLEKMISHYAILQNDYPYSYQMIEKPNTSVYPTPPPIGMIFSGLTILFFMFSGWYSLISENRDGKK